VTLLRNGLRWQVRPELIVDGDCPLLDDKGLRLQEWLEAGQARVLKQAPHRTIYRLTLPGLDLHLKYYPLNDLRAVLRQLVRPSKARMEHDRACTVLGRGVPTIEPLALGEPARGLGPSYLVTRTLTDTQSLNGYLENVFPLLPRARQTHIRQRLAVAVGRLLARMHDAGIVHEDLHPGNLLVHFGPEDEPTLYLVDLLMARLRSALDWPASRDNLVMLNRWFVLRSEPGDRLRFWHAYREARQTLPAGAMRGPAERELERDTVESNRLFWRQYDRHCVARNRHFRKLRAPGVRGHAVADLLDHFVRELLADPDAPFSRPDARILKESRSSKVVEFRVPTAQGERTVIYKRFAVTRWSDPLASLFRPAPALRSYLFGHGLRNRCLPTPRPLCVLHRSRGGMFHEGYLLTEKVGEGHDLLEYLASLRELVPGVARKRMRALTEQVARLVRQLHQRGLSHRDLKACNLLVSSDPWMHTPTDRSREGTAAPADPDNPQVLFIDLVGVRVLGRLSRRRRARDLARLYASYRNNPAVSRADCVRFLCTYLQWGLRGRRDWKAWWRAIARETAAKVRRSQMTGRLLL
jgi:tRNA A-37 threonylcarbamoyl transferase component Bud32